MSATVVEWHDGMDALGSAIAAIGVFDGVHVGHVELIRDTVRLAAERGVRSAVVTFDRDPEQVVVPDRHVPQLLTLDDKLALVGGLGVDVILVIPFSVAMAQMPAERFLGDVLLGALDPVAIAVGQDFRFGHHAAGSVTTLERFGASHGFDVVAYPLVERDGAPVTSTRIRALIAAGDVAGAARLLGRPHRVSGTVVHGRGEGVPVTGVPTANVMPWAHAALPADGVYAGSALVDGDWYAAAISVGRPPMFPAALDRLEAHLLDFDGDLYGTELVLEFASRLRDQQFFDSSAQLREAILADISRVRAERQP